MLKEFFGYYKPDFEKLWDEAIFVPDANVILSLYRFSENASGDLFQILSKLKDKERIWMPYQFVFEYHENLLTIFRSIEDDYGKSAKKLSQQSEELCDKLKPTLNQFRNRNGFDSTSLMSQVETDLDNILQEYSKFAEAHSKRLRESPFEEKISKFLEGAFGEAYASDRMEELRKEGDRRFEQSTPPLSRKDVKNKPDPYGDLVGWFQIIDYAKGNKRSVILITDDKDWYIQKQGVIHPHPQLLKEMHDNAGVSSYIYKTGQFMEYARKYLEAQVSDETIEEAENREKYVAEQESVTEQHELAIRADDFYSPILSPQPALADDMKSIIDQHSTTGGVMNSILEERQLKTDAMMNSIAEKQQRRIDAMMKPIFEAQQSRVDAFLEEQQHRIDKSLKPFLKEQRRVADNVRKKLSL